MQRLSAFVCFQLAPWVSLAFVTHRRPLYSACMRTVYCTVHCTVYSYLLRVGAVAWWGWGWGAWALGTHERQKEGWQGGSTW